MRLEERDGEEVSRHLRRPVRSNILHSGTVFLVSVPEGHFTLRLYFYKSMLIWFI